MSDDRKKVVLVCDTMNEIDDQFAIAYALGSNALEVLGLISSQNTLVHGPNSVYLYKEEAHRIANLCGEPNLPLFIGAETPMESMDKPIGSEGVDFLAQLCKEKINYSILGTGPATDLAAFRMLYPNIAKKIPIVWAGSFPNEKIWKKKKYGELNARADIHAWRVLYQDPVNLVVLPGWPGVAKVAVEPDLFVEELRMKRKKITDYLASILETWCNSKKILDMDSARSTKVLWDIVNVSYYSIPNAVMIKDLPIPKIDAAGSMYWSQITANIPICMDVDAPAILRDFWNAIENIK